MQLSLFESQVTVKGKVKKLDISGFKSYCPDKVRPFLRYPGSKFNASKYIEPFWRKIDFYEYREPFLGSGAIFFKMPKVDFSWLNDIDLELINTFRIIANPSTREKLIEKIKNLEPSKEYFEKLKYSNPVSEMDKAFRYFVINRTAYSGIMNLPNWGFHPTKSVQPDKWSERIVQSGKKLRKNVKITTLDFEEVILSPASKKVWIFVDPPYFKADQKRAYFHSFQIEDHLKLSEILEITPHNFCLTYDNCDEVKKIYKWANIYEIEWMYHTANSNVTSRKVGRELIITNY